MHMATKYMKGCSVVTYHQRNANLNQNEISSYTFWEDNMQEGQRSPKGGNRLQVSDIFISFKRQEEKN